MTIIMGLDLSARAAAAVAVPLAWDGRWSRVSSVVVGEELAPGASDAERARRGGRIAAQLIAFARANNVLWAWIEGYAFSMQSRSVSTLCEVGGVVRLALVEAGIGIHTANMGTARKLLLGKVPRKSAKVAAAEALRAAGSPAWTLDESDAFVCANLGLSEHAGAFCFATPAPQPEPRKRKAKP